VSILLSGATRAALRDRFPLREIDRLRVKGRDEAVVVHQAMLDDERLDDVALARFADARAAYARCDFAVALAGFEAVLSAAPQDGPSRVFANRCRRFIDAPPPAGWDGTWPPAGSG
jgi:adenylate cyclase